MGHVTATTDGRGIRDPRLDFQQDGEHSVATHRHVVRGWRPDHRRLSAGGPTDAPTAPFNGQRRSFTLHRQCPSRRLKCRRPQVCRHSPCRNGFWEFLNSVFEIERKLATHGDPGNASRNVERLKDTLAEEGFFFENPMGQPFSETRTDLEASISGAGTDNLVVVEVIKPIVRFGTHDSSRVVQKGIVVVQSKEQEGQ